MATTQEAVRRLTIEATSRGVTQTTDQLKKLQAAQGGVTVTSRETEKATLSVERRLNSIQRQYDRNFRATQAMAKVERDLTAAQTQGLITLRRKNELLVLAAQRHRAAGRAAIGHSTALLGASRAYGLLAGGIGGFGAFTIGRKVITEFAEFERGLIGVGKTTDIEGEKLQQLGRGVQEIARVVPVATTELLSIAQAAGQLGVKGSADILRFTETVGKLGLASNLSGEEAATTLARILTVTGTDFADVDRLGSTIVRLGNNFAATEAEIAAVATRVAQSTALFGVTASAAAGIGTALKAVGVEAEAGGTVVGRAYQAINDAVRQGGKEMENFSRITGLTGQQLREIFEKDATLAFEAVIKGLGRINDSGGDVTSALDSVGLEGVRVVQVLGTLATRSDVLSDALRQSSDEWKNNTALTKEAIVATQSFTAQMQLAANDIDAGAAAIGRALAPEIIKATVNMREFIQEAERSGQLAEFGQTVGEAFAFAAENAGALTTALQVLIGVRLGAAFGPWGALAGGLAAGMLTLVTSTDSVTEATERLQSATNSAVTAGDSGKASALALADARLKQAKATLQAAEAEATLAAGGMGFIGEENFRNPAAAAKAAQMRAEIEAAERKLLGARNAGVSEPGEVPSGSSLTVPGGASKKAPLATSTQSDGADKVLENLRFQQQQLQRTALEQEIYNNLKQAGVGIDSTYGQNIAFVTTQIHDQTEAQERLNDQMETGKALAHEFASSFISDMRNGASATEALSNSLDRLVDRLIDMALDQAINSLFKNLIGAAAGGIGSGATGIGSSSLGGLAGSIYHNGGVVGQTPTTSRYIHPAYFDNAPRFARGGIAGLGPDEVPVIAHKNEEIIRRDDPRHRANGGGGGSSRIEVVLSPDLEARILSEADSGSVRITQEAIGQYDRRLPKRMEGEMPRIRKRNPYSFTPG